MTKKSKNSKNSKKANSKTVVVVAAPETKMRAVPLVQSRSVPKPFMRVLPQQGKGFDHVRVQGCEIVSKIALNSNFTQVFTAPLNPLNPSLFPKLSSIAALFEKWRMSGAFKVSYRGSCPATRSGAVSAYIETDVGDSAVSSSVIEVMNQKYNLSCSAWEDATTVMPANEQSNVWLYTQQSVGSDLEGARTTFAGILYAFTSDAVLADQTLLAGYLIVEYDITFCVFRPPTSTGFLLVNPTTQTIAASGAAQDVKPSNGQDAGNLGSWASRYLYSGLYNLISTGAKYTESLSYYVNPPTLAITDMSVAVDVGAATEDEKESSSLLSGVNNDYVELKTPTKPALVRSGRNRVRDTSGFQPYLSFQKPDGTWWYILVPNGTAYPYSSLKLGLPEPAIAGDVTLQLIVDNGDGTSTVLATSPTFNSLVATTVSIFGSVAPFAPSYLRVAITAVYTTARAINYVRWLTGPARENGGKA